MAGAIKAEGALRTISEVSAQLAIPHHILRYWETRFPQLRPLQRAGNRRYYRPEDVALVERIHGLLNREGYTIKGVQKLLAMRGAGPAQPPTAPIAISPSHGAFPITTLSSSTANELRQIRAQLAMALSDENGL